MPRRTPPVPSRTLPPFRRLVSGLLGGVGLLWLGYAALAWAGQRQLLFPGQHLSPPPGTGRIEGLERWWLGSGERATEAWFLPPLLPQDGPGPAVIFAHGNGELIDHWPAALRPYREMGLAVLLVEYPGYGRSGGSPSEASITRAALAAYDRLVARADIDPARIVLHGRSLGGGVVAVLSDARAAAALVLESSFTGVTAFASGMLLPPLLVRDPFDVEGPVGRFRGPVLVLHGRRDGIVPPEHGERLVRAARDGRLVLFDAGHNDLRLGDRGWEAIAELLRRAGVL